MKKIGIVGRITGKEFIHSDNTKKISMGSRVEYINAFNNLPVTIIILPITEDTEKMQKQINLCDGLLIQGGGDSKQEEQAQIEYIKYAIKVNKPLLGICAGMQQINIACGGNLKLIKANNHMQNAPYYKPFHNILIKPDSLLFKHFGALIKVNSVHRYQINKLGKNIKVLATSEDNITEAIILTNKKFIFGIQFHPEHLIIKNKIWENLFKEFVEIC